MKKAAVLCVLAILTTLYCSLVEGGWCSRTVLRYERRTICCRLVWNHCNWWEYRTTTTYANERYCCIGWTGNNCNTPICDPGCYNGGTCIAPNQCKCLIGMTGRFCKRVTCSHIKPCFPGRCDETSMTKCSCINGFTGPKCLTMMSSQQPHITHASTTMKLIPKAGKFKNHLIYKFMSDASEPNTTKPDHRWIHFNDFNELEFLVKAMYVPPNIPNRPYYLEDYKFGIISGNVRAIVSKVPRLGNNKDIAFDHTYTLDGVNSMNPELKVAVLNHTDKSFVSNIEHGDNLTITATVNSGGFAKLRDVNTGAHYSTSTYIGQESKKVMVFHFDFEPANHCSEKRNTCFYEPINIGPDITKQKLHISWDGWTDELAGIFRYNWEIHHLRADARGNLTEVSPMEPFHLKAMVKEEYKPFTYTPPGPGIYSIILDVADKANNSRFARQFVLYDPVSNITTDETFKLYVSSAERETHYNWQSNVQNQMLIGPSLSVSWKGHFRNKFHEDNQLLNSINSFHVTAMDGMYHKDVDNELDDMNGKRTRKAIPNIHGIVLFEIAYAVDHQGGKTITEIPTAISSWKKVDNLLHENQTIDVKRSDGDTVRIWVRSTDIMGNVKEDSTVVHIDTTPPTISAVKIETNVNSTKFDFASRVYVRTEDDESGIYKIEWRIRDEKTGKVFKTGKLSGNKTNEMPGTFGRCIPMGDCYFFKHTIDINNCWMIAPKANLTSQLNLTLELDVLNMAMKSSTKKEQISNIMQLKGVKHYSGPINFRVDKIYSNGVKLKWTTGKSCYDIQDILITILSNSGKEETRHAYKNADLFDIVGLESNTNYTIKFVTRYAEDSSDPVYFSFVTEPTTDSVRWNLTSAAERHDVSCLSDSISVFIPSDLLSHYQTTWRDPHCQVQDNGTHYVSTISHTSCGTTVIFTKDEVIFENELILHKSGSPSNQTSNGSIDFGSSDSEVIPVQCIYPRRQNISTLYRPAQSTVRFYEKRYGHMDVQLEQYKSGMFVTPLPVRSFPNEVEINKDMYFILHAMHVNSTDVAVKVDSCVATPSNIPADGRIYQLLDQGCPASPAVKVYPSAFDEVRFSVRAFEFRTSPGGIVYIHCQVSVCSPTSPQCRVGCAHRHRREVSTEDGGSHLVSGGPYLLVADKGGLQVSTVVAGVCASVAVVATVIAIIGWRRKSSASTSNSKL